MFDDIIGPTKKPIRYKLARNGVLIEKAEIINTNTSVKNFEGYIVNVDINLTNSDVFTIYTYTDEGNSVGIRVFLEKVSDCKFKFSNRMS